MILVKSVVFYFQFLCLFVRLFCAFYFKYKKYTNMDYKFIILLLVIVGLILFFTRELDNMKCEMSDKLDKIASYVDNSSKNTLFKMQNGFGMCVNKIKTINGDYIEQVRKMNEYGNQPITNMSNHYTDTDSQGNGMKFAALSDCKMSRTSVKKQQSGESFYLSEDEPKKVKNNVVDEFKIILPPTEEKPPHTFNLCTDFIDDENNHITTESVSSNSQKKVAVNNDVENVEENEIKEYNFNDVDENDIEESENDDDGDVSVENSEHSGHSSNYGSITFGSKKPHKKNSNEDDSVATSNIQKLTITSFLTKDMYTSDILKKIAKELAIPISHKDGSIRRQLRKDELYDKIKVHLSENK